jgi:hypothetical protein
VSTAAQFNSRGCFAFHASKLLESARNSTAKEWLVNAIIPPAAPDRQDFNILLSEIDFSDHNACRACE